MNLFACFLLTFTLVSTKEEVESERMGNIFQKNNITMLIHGGSDVEPHSLPYQVGLHLLSQTSVGLCGGSLISRRWILTAAHCLLGVSAVFVHLGAHELKRPLSRGQFKYMALPFDFIIHENYYYPFTMNDIALIRARILFELNDQVQTIRLPSIREALDPMIGVEAVASGWGDITDEGNKTETLQSVNLQVISLQECAKHYVVTLGNICTNGSAFKSPCKGDSGGPLVAHLPSGPTLIGLTSFGSRRGCKAGLPAVFVRVGYYLKWISLKTGILIEV